MLTLATATEEGAPYCCNLFYAYDKDDKAFVFTSGPDTLHARMLARNALTAASIVLETRVVRNQNGSRKLRHRRHKRRQQRSDHPCQRSRYLCRGSGNN
ncbi:pyridoxamine 5'-phosphate oxidase family protein [uncultured Duncaniella sp.]|uniref:pyridoxamine 5'-phosphate oxidase family protein n=1 Tax=uncultured Duncaniella sp. TaxID=2768039 RepID=UPI0034A18BA2